MFKNSQRKEKLDGMFVAEEGIVLLHTVLPLHDLITAALIIVRVVDYFAV